MEDNYNDRPVMLENPFGTEFEILETEGSQEDVAEPEFEAKTVVELDDDALNNNELREKYSTNLEGVKCVLIDIYGTLYNPRSEDASTNQSAADAYLRLRESGCKAVLAVNSWLMSKKNILEELHKVGFEVDETDIFTSSDCCKIFMTKHCCKHPFLLVSDDVATDFEEFDTSNPAELDSVILGLPSTHIDYRLVTKIFTMLESGKPMIVLNSAKCGDEAGHGSVLGPGLFGKLLEFATDSKEFVSGKPTAGFYIEACKYAGYPPNECVMIGDDIDADIRGAKSAKLKGILVKTGKYNKRDETKYCHFLPDAVAKDFPTAIHILLCVQPDDPSMNAAKTEEALKKVKLESDKNDFALRLAGYTAADDCREKVPCVRKLPSYIW